MEDVKKGTVAEVRDIVEQYMPVRVVDVVEPGTGLTARAIIDSDTVRPVPIEVFDQFRANPKFRRGSAHLTKIDSLIEHVNRFKDDDSVLFAIDDRTRPSLTAVLNYHAAGAKGSPRFGDHRAHFAFPLSDEWKAWTEKDGAVFKMAEFAHFLEDRIIDVLELIAEEDSLPEDMQRFVNICGGTVASPNKLVELSRGLQVFEKASVGEAINLATGEAQISFQSEHTNSYGSALNVPGLFLIGIPIFKHGPIYRIAARLRYRKTPEGLFFFYELWRADRSFDHAFNEACERVQIETELPLLFGWPE